MLATEECWEVEERIKTRRIEYRERKKRKNRWRKKRIK